MDTLLAIGLDKVNENLMGWNGECIGAAADASNWYELAEDSCKRIKLLNEEATLWNINAELCDIIKEAKAGNIKVIYITFSGHTGQIREELLSGDPDADAKDELLVVYDSHLPDWMLEAFLREIPKGVSVILIMDTCNAGGLISPRMLGVEGDVYLLAAVREGSSAFGDASGGRLTKALQTSLKSMGLSLTLANLIVAYSKMPPVDGQQTVLFSNAICGATPPQPQENTKTEGKMNCVSKLLIKLGLLMSLRSPSEKALGAVEIAKEMFDAPGSGKARLLLYGENCDGKTFSLFGTVIPQQVISPLTLAIYGCGLAISDGQLVFGRSGGVPTKQ